MTCQWQERHVCARHPICSVIPYEYAPFNERLIIYLLRRLLPLSYFVSCTFRLTQASQKF